jgi:uncharacterized protein YabN with tetrapyrrole methylase and pyrophosphatase domain
MSQPVSSTRSSTNHEIPFEIYVVGLGIVGRHQVTREADGALRRCREVFVVHYEPSLTQYISTLCETVTDLGSLYKPGAIRENIYQEMANRVLAGAADHPPVCLALYGHPLVFVSPTQFILRTSAEQGLRTKVLPGISAMDCLLIDLHLDPASEGLQMYEATDLVLRARPLQPDVPCLIWQIGSVGNLRYLQTLALREHVLRLRNYLLGFYPPGHEVIVAATPIVPIAKPKLMRVSIEQLDGVHDQVSSRDTLYIPPVRHRGIHDELFRRFIVPAEPSVQDMSVRSGGSARQRRAVRAEDTLSRDL